MEKKRILVVDDEETVLKGFKETLEEEGYEVDTAKTGEEAIEKSKAHFYHLALLDIRLPDMEGTELLTAMKKTTPDMVKIMVTGYPSQKNAVEAVNKGADGYIIKPVLKMEDLLNMVKEHLKKQEEAGKYSQEKIKEFIESRVEELESKREKQSETKQ